MSALFTKKTSKVQLKNQKKGHLFRHSWKSIFLGWQSACPKDRQSCFCGIVLDQTNKQTIKQTKKTWNLTSVVKRGVFSGTLENRSSWDDSLHATKDRRGCFCGITDEFCIFLWCHNHDVLRLWAHYWHRKYHLDFQICLNYVILNFDENEDGFFFDQVWVTMSIIYYALKTIHLNFDNFHAVM